MQKEYRGYEIRVAKEKALGGWNNAYLSVFRLSDGLEVICEISSPLDRSEFLIECMERRIDEFIETEGASELLADEY